MEHLNTIPLEFVNLVNFPMFKWRGDFKVRKFLGWNMLAHKMQMS